MHDALIGARMGFVRLVRGTGVSSCSLLSTEVQLISSYASFCRKLRVSVGRSKKVVMLCYYGLADFLRNGSQTRRPSRTDVQCSAFYVLQCMLLPVASFSWSLAVLSDSHAEVADVVVVVVVVSG
jgi:hypothetical protein